MDYFKDFTYKLRKFSYTSEVIIYLFRVAPKLLQIVRLLTEVKFEEGSYHTYYGEVKRIISGFLAFYYVVMDDIIKEADRLDNLATREELLVLIENTNEIQKMNLEDFLRDYIPVNDTERNKVLEIKELYKGVAMKTRDMQMTIDQLSTKSAAREFARQNSTKCLHVIKGMCEFGYTYLSVMLAEDNDPSKAGRAIETMQMKIEHFDSNASVRNIKEEVAFWENKLADFNKVADNLNKIKAAMELQNGLYVVPLREKWEKEARTLLTFYACRGIDRIIYTDNVGKYYLDEYNHQVYVVDYGLGDYHVSCSNKFIMPTVKQYYFDKHGRYVYQAGKMMYQLAPCGSYYKLGEDGVLDKPQNPEEAGLTDDEFEINQCRRKIKDPNDITLLPDCKPINVTSTLDKDNASYLWDTFGCILPHALHDVALANSKNPIHFLAHRLLFHKYNVSKKDHRDRKIAADVLKANIYKGRQEKLLSASMAWKSKQVKRNAEESDDTQERAVYDAHIAREELKKSLNYFYD